jgi:hypothetical protein
MNAAIKNAEISRRILVKVAEGMNVRQALDAVCGEGMFSKLVSNLYDELRQQSAS